ncbi:ABC transporter ATP-binding protein [Cumulibacter manganitolerans]|uniref:ABC transporter ATP-binding protein n=1 Tax=Cumulibacter manganitolerans TaxID=1884992 RepID=UPI0012981122|nr:ABC transporter ATP-binding protein [Cumulibacter manganitolerans]
MSADPVTPEVRPVARERFAQKPVAPEDVAISIRGVSKKFRVFTDRKTNLKELFTDRKRSNRTEEFWALRDISFDIPKGKTFGLIGHNGSGKSTLLKLIAGIHRPSSGEITSAGRISAMLELGAGFHPELSGRENIYLNGSILGLTRKQINEAMDKIIDFSGLREFIDTPVKVYSSGMFVRLGFAIAVNLEPEILVIDEVIAVGDEEFQRKCFDHLYELRRKGVTIILVSHSLGLMAELCDEVAWLDHGVLQGVGKARDLTDAYLESVNKREAESAGESNEYHDQVADAGRRSTGEIHVTGVEFLGRAGEPAGFLSTGERATIRVRYEAASALEMAAFGISIDHESGFHITDMNSGHARGGDPIPAGAGHIDFVIDELPLMPGVYELSTIVSHQAKVFESRERAFKLTVRTNDSTLGGGVARTVGSWTLPSSGG